MKIFKTRERLQIRESHLKTKLATAAWCDTADHVVMSGIDGALHLIGKTALPEPMFEKLRERLKTAGVSHNLPAKDPRSKPVLAKGETLPTETAFNEMLREIRSALFVKKDALIAEQRLAIRQARGFAKARKVIHNLLRDHKAGARRALEAMAEGKPAPSWILRSVAVATK